MEKERRIKILSIIALIVAILGLTVAFAALSETLTINGTANVEAASWDIHFENLTGPVLEGTGKVNDTAILSGTTISNVNMSVSKPGDSVTYYFDIVNDGTIDAVLDTELNNSLFYKGYQICSIRTGDSECLEKYDFDGNGIVGSLDGSIILNDLDYAIYNTETNKILSKGDVKPKQTTKHYKLVLAIKPESEYISSKNLSAQDDIELNFVQQ